MAHSHISMTNLPPINLLIGENDTGKTGLLKLLYGTVKALEVHRLKQQNGGTTIKKELSTKLYNTFMPRNKGLGDLVQKSSENKRLSVDIDIAQGSYQQKVHYAWGESTSDTITDCSESHGKELPENINTLFVPAKEVLTAFKDIRNIRNNYYGTGFDDTYLDLINALDLPTTPGRLLDELKQVNQNLEKLFDGKIEQTKNIDQPFIFKKGNQKFAMQQTAEGIKKIGILTTLINNRQLGKGTILFMDEPEANLHPKAIRELVKMIVGMSKAGVQVFLASHSYFVIKQLAISALQESVTVGCWSLERTEDRAAVETTFHDMSEGVLPQNRILEESMEMYEEDVIVKAKA